MRFNFSGAPMSTARKMAHEGRRAVAETASDLAERAEDMGHSARKMASRYFREGRKAARHSAQSVEHFVEEQPLRTALLALGVGCIVCALLIRR